MEIHDSKSTRDLLVRLIQKHNVISFAVAWASANNDVYGELQRNFTKIRYGVIGTHFYQTDYRVLSWGLIRKPNIRFIFDKSTKSVFHPKVFVFESRGKWDLVIGSANLTTGGMDWNDEIMIHVSHVDGDDNLIRSMKRSIKNYWDKSESITRSKLESYRKNSMKWRRKNYESKDLIRGVPDFMTWGWGKYYREIIRRREELDLDGSCDLLRLAGRELQSVDSFRELNLDSRLAIAGISTPEVGKWSSMSIGSFGYTRGNGNFQSLIRTNNRTISEAIDAIPFKGDVERESFLAYTEAFSRAFHRKTVQNDGLGTALRLPIMKRPDIFVPWNSGNSPQLKQLLGIRPNIHGKQYARYWDEVLSRVHGSEWYNSRKPSSGLELKVWKYRAAMVDRLTYRSVR